MEILFLLLFIIGRYLVTVIIIIISKFIKPFFSSSYWDIYTSYCTYCKHLQKLLKTCIQNAFEHNLRVCRILHVFILYIFIPSLIFCINIFLCYNLYMILSTSILKSSTFVYILYKKSANVNKIVYSRSEPYTKVEQRFW